tara:strand:+ start:14 stop:745 length:732 start_codon:yes stop_codon:yes gene_type:complete
MEAEQISKNWDKHLAIVEKFISEERKEQVEAMLEELSDKMILAPASGKSHFHNAFPGGYIDHVNRVVYCALKTKALWEEMGADINFTDEELVFSALFHDLGKVGDGEKEGYLRQNDQWRQKNLNEQYTPNKELPFMLIQDRSLYILQKFGISLSHNEYMAIRLHDGIYDDANKAYFIGFNPDSKFRTNIVNILHQADYLASKVEYDTWYQSKDHTQEEVVKKTRKGPKKVKGSKNLSNLIKNI